MPHLDLDAFGDDVYRAGALFYGCSVTRTIVRSVHYLYPVFPPETFPEPDQFPEIPGWAFAFQRLTPRNERSPHAVLFGKHRETGQNATLYLMGHPRPPPGVDDEDAVVDEEPERAASRITAPDFAEVLVRPPEPHRVALAGLVTRLAALATTEGLAINHRALAYYQRDIEGLPTTDKPGYFIAVFRLGDRPLPTINLQGLRSIRGWRFIAQGARPHECALLALHPDIDLECILMVFASDARRIRQSSSSSLDLSPPPGYVEPLLRKPAPSAWESL